MWVKQLSGSKKPKLDGKHFFFLPSERCRRASAFVGGALAPGWEVVHDTSKEDAQVPQDGWTRVS